LSIRHVAPLAFFILAGCAAPAITPPSSAEWRIMVPPGGVGTQKVDTNVPVSTWKPIGAPYASQDLCELGIDTWREYKRREASPPGVESGLEVAQCVSTDDARFKSN
jgi:hypothetical protein